MSIIHKTYYDASEAMSYGVWEKVVWEEVDTNVELWAVYTELRLGIEHTILTDVEGTDPILERLPRREDNLVISPMRRMIR